MKIPASVVIAIAVLGAGCSTPKQTADDSDSDPFLPFRSHPPIADANPSVRHQRVVRVPTKLTIKRTDNSLTVGLDPKSLSPAKITVGSKMETGVEAREFIYPLGEAKPATSQRYFEGSDIEFDFNPDTFNTEQGGIPIPGKKYVIEIDLTIFETDIPAQHMWDPHSEKFKTLWARTLRACRKITFTKWRI